MTTIVHVAAYFVPASGFGGPPQSLLALCRAQQDAGLSVEVFTTTADQAGELAPCPDGDEVGGIRVRRFPLSVPRAWLGASSMAGPLTRRLREADVLHLHGVFNRTIWIAGAAARKTHVPYLLSPRGMLEPAALAHHGWRKKVSYAVHDGAILTGAARWHATSSAEAATLAARPGARPIVEIPNSVAPVDAGPVARRSARTGAGVGDAPFILFLGRIHPIKRLDILADAFAAAARAHPEWHLVIAGPDEGGHRASLASRFAPLGARVRWLGEVEGDVKAGLLAEARALVLCSDSESFGMSVAEALSAGTPAVVTRTCPWPSLEPAGAGAWVEQNAAAIAEGLERVAGRAAEAAEMGARGRVHVDREFSARAVAARWVDCYAELVREARANRHR